jgi:ArsR family transcriptional regulator
MSKRIVVRDTDSDPCCAPISEVSLDPTQAVDLARVFKALGDPIRLRLLSRITSAVNGEICVCDITGHDFDVSGPTISHHLKVLREAGLIEGERRGTWVYYRPVTANLRQLASVLDAPAVASIRPAPAGCGTPRPMSVV